MDEALPDIAGIRSAPGGEACTAQRLRQAPERPLTVRHHHSGRGLMTDITLQGLSPRHLAILGDAALTAGDMRMAQGFYRRLVRVDPSPQAHARLGLALRPNKRTTAML